MIIFQLVNDYLMNRDDKELQIASCRLVLDILPGLETSVVFNDTVRKQHLPQ